MKPYREVGPQDWRRVAMYVLLAVLVIAVSGVAFAPLFWPYGLIVWLVVFVAGALVALVRWHAGATAYRCGVCGHEFEISARVDFLSPHMVNMKYLKCPACGGRTWTKVLMKQ